MREDIWAGVPFSMGTAARRQDYDYLIKLLLIGDSGKLAIILQVVQALRHMCIVLASGARIMLIVESRTCD